MARVFVSDCLKQIPCRNELVVMAAKHARTIKLNANVRQRNRAVEALREIEAGKISKDQIIDNWYRSIRPKSQVVAKDID